MLGYFDDRLNFIMFYIVPSNPNLRKRPNYGNNNQLVTIAICFLLHFLEIFSRIRLQFFNDIYNSFLSQVDKDT